MSFAQPFAEARGIQNAIQKEKTDGRDGEMSSPIRDGATEPGTTLHEPISELVPRRTHLHTRTDMLTRKYGSTGSGDGGQSANKGYSSSKIGKKNLSGR